MRKWVLIGIGAVAAASVVGFIVLRSNTSESPLTGASPTPRGSQSSTVAPSLDASPNATDSSSENKPTSSPTTPSLDGPVVVTSGGRAASNLESQSSCREDEPGKGFVDLKWAPAAQRGQEQKLQVTIFREGFESGTFQLSEALTPDRASYRWTRSEGQANHYWRVLTRHSDGWTPSETARFAGPHCVGV